MVLLIVIIAGVLLLIFVVGILAYFIARNATEERSPISPQHQNNDSENALNILDKRYARGELTKSEYEQMKRDILNR